MDNIRLSKTISLALRHEPEKFGLRLDDEGWVPLEDLLKALKTKGFHATQEIIEQLMAQSEKQRFQIADGRIRAYYGHSIETKILKQPHCPPEILYHGTVTEVLDAIRETGLRPMSRQYVHLSADEQTANVVARRRRGKTIILKVKAKEAYDNGIPFYREENGIWLSEPIPPAYLSE